VIDGLTVEGSLVETEMPRQVTVSFRAVKPGSQAIAGSFRSEFSPRPSAGIR